MLPLWHRRGTGARIRAGRTLPKAVGLGASLKVWAHPSGGQEGEGGPKDQSVLLLVWVVPLGYQWEEPADPSSPPVVWIPCLQAWICQLETPESEGTCRSASMSILVCVCCVTDCRGGRPGSFSTLPPPPQLTETIPPILHPAPGLSMGYACLVSYSSAGAQLKVSSGNYPLLRLSCTWNNQKPLSEGFLH